MEYFVSYYDYYQPEAYIPSTDTYIEKDSAINEEIDRLRHSATAALSERRDVIIVASVSCIYSLGDPIDYRSMVISVRQGMHMSRDELMHRLVALQYERNDLNFVRNKFRVRGDIVEINLAYMNDVAIRIEFFGDEVDRISEVNALTGERHAVIRHIAIFPASHYIVSGDKMRAGLANIRDELDRQVKAFTGEGSCWRPSALPSAPITTLRCLPKWAPARASRTTPLFCRAVRPVPRRQHCWIISPRISCCLWTRAM